MALSHGGENGHSSSGSSSPLYSPDRDRSLTRSSGSEIFKFNVGGRIYMTTRSTLFSHGKNFLTVMIENDEANRVPCARDENGAIFIDRNADAFGVVLDFLRTGNPSFSHPLVTREQLKVEFDFYQIEVSEPADECRKEFLQHSPWLRLWKKETQKWSKAIRPFILKFMVLKSEGSHTSTGYIPIVDSIRDNKQLWYLSYSVQRFPDKITSDDHRDFVRVMSQEEDFVSDPLPPFAVYTVTSPDGDRIQYNVIWWNMAVQFLSQIFDNKITVQLQDDGGHVYKRLFLNWSAFLDVHAKP